MSFLDPVLGPFLLLNPTIAILVLSLIISVVVTISYKYLTDQKLMKQLKNDLKELQAEMKASRNNTKKLMELQKEAMEKNMTYMSHSMKPSLITLIPLIFIFGWMNANFAYVPIAEGADFHVDVFTKVDGPIMLEIVPMDMINITNGANQTATGKNATWNLTGKSGEYTLKFKMADEVKEVSLIIGKKYANPENRFGEGNIEKIIIGNEKLKTDFIFFKIGWIWAYIIFSIIFSMVIRKIFDIH